MTKNKRAPSRRYSTAQERRVRRFSELNHGLTPAQLGKAIPRATLEQARREREAQADYEADHEGSHGPKGLQS